MPLPQKPPPLPDVSDDRCKVCGQTAPFLFRDTYTKEVIGRWCRLHLPADNPIPPSLTRLLEEAYLERAQVTGPQNESSPR